MSLHSSWDKEREERTRGTAFGKERKMRSGIRRRVGILENKKEVPPFKGMEDERSGAGD